MPPGNTPSSKGTRCHFLSPAPGGMPGLRIQKREHRGRSLPVLRRFKAQLLYAGVQPDAPLVPGGREILRNLRRPDPVQGTAGDAEYINLPTGSNPAGIFTLQIVVISQSVCHALITWQRLCKV